MKLNLVYFARVRKQMQTPAESINVESNIATVAELQSWLIDNNPQFAQMLQTTPKLLVAVNQTSATGKASVCDNDEIAFFPPVTGG